MAMTCSFENPGTYFPALRGTSHGQGDTRTPYARIRNVPRAPRGGQIAVAGLQGRSAQAGNGALAGAGKMERPRDAALLVESKVLDRRRIWVKYSFIQHGHASFYAAKRLTAESIHSTPVPTTSSKHVIPFST